MPEFIRERAMDDPRMKYVPLLQEERFQSMVAVPILSRASETIGVIVLHTQAPHEFTEDTLKLLVHIASLVCGAIENAQLYDRERRRVDALTGLSELAQEVAAATGADELARSSAEGTRRLLRARRSASCYRLERTTGRCACSPPIRPRLPAPPTLSAAELLIARSTGSGSGPARARPVAGRSTSPTCW